MAGGHKTTASAKNARKAGYEYEREIVGMLKAIGLKAKRVPLSGGAPEWEDDIVLRVPFVGNAQLECKLRAAQGDRTKVIRGWLGDADMLFFRIKTPRGQKKSDNLVVVRGEFMGRILAALVRLEANVAEAREEAADVAEELEKALKGGVG